MNFVKSWLIAFPLIALWGNANAAIDVCGSINEVWTISDSPVNVTCDLNVAALTIEAGVEVHVAGNYDIVVSGVLRSLGTEASPVVFKPVEENVTGWGGFFFEDTIDGSEFRWTHIEGATSSAVHLVRSTPLFDHVTFKDNSATYGGAIRAEPLGNDLQISNSLFINNFAGTAGGAIYSVDPSGTGEVALVVTDSVFRENLAGTTGTHHNTWGGAISVNGNSRILRSTFRDNEARAYTIWIRGGRYTQGCAIYTWGGRSEIIASSFISNACRMSAHGQTPDASRTWGGALNLGSGELLLSNSLVAENELLPVRNHDPRGAGLYVAGGTATIVNTTMANNSHHAIYNAGGTVDLLNSILFFNNNSGSQIAGTVNATYSAIQNGFDGEGNISANPILNEQYGIVPPSPAIDAGKPSLEYDDIFPPGQGQLRNDLGYSGGPSAEHWNNLVCYRDADGDGYGNPRAFVFMQSCAFDYVPDGTDCDDSDPTVFPGSGGSCDNNTGITGVCGLISQGEVWSMADSPVNVICDLNVAALTIEPGVEVHVAGNYDIVVSGVLRSLGTEASPVVFKPVEENVTGWGGFYFEDTIDGSEFRWTRIEGATSSAVHLVRSTPLFDHVTFKDNDSATYGGAIRAELSGNDLQISNSLFVNNFAGTAGGAIYSVDPSGTGEAALVVTDSVFRENLAGTTGTHHNTWGGAISVNGNSRILRSTFRDNEARAYTIWIRGGRYTQGCAIYTWGGRSEIIASSFISNACRMSAHGQTPDASRTWGGALNLGSGELLLSNSLVAENELLPVRNHDPRGAGLYVAGGTATIVNTTMANNSHHAIYNAGGTVDLLNSILFFNNNSGSQIAGTVNATYSAIQNGFDGEGNISVNPILNEQYDIVPPSPAIDAGDSDPQFNDICLPPSLGTVRNDMGAYGGPLACDWKFRKGDFDKDCDIDGSDLAVFFSDFGRTNCDEGVPCEGDFDADFDVDGSDLSEFSKWFGSVGCGP